MKITYITSIDPRQIGGPSNHVIAAINALSSTHQVTLLHARRRLLHRTPAGVRCKTQSVYFPPRRGGWKYFERAMAFQVRRREARIDEILYLRFNPSFPMARALQATKKFVVFELNGMEISSHPAIIKMLHSADLILVGTPVTKVALVEEYPSLVEKVFFHSNVGIDSEVFKPQDRGAARTSLGFGKNLAIILHVSGFQPYHDYLTLLTGFKLALSDRANARLILVGDGIRRHEIETLVNSLNLSGVVSFLGSITPDKLPQIIAASDVCVNPMLVKKLFQGNLNAQKSFEYIACGRPVVESCEFSLPVPEWATEHLNCIPAENPEALCDAVLTVLRDPSRWHDRTELARLHVLANFSWTAVVNRTIVLIEQAMRVA